MEIRSVAAPHCPECGAAGSLLYEGLEDRLFGAPGRWSLLRCDACALVWLSPRPEPSEIARLYGDYHTHDEEPAPGVVQRAVRGGIPAAVLGYGGADLLSRVLARVGPLREAGVRSALGLAEERRGRLLDVGCGSGLLLAILGDLGWAVSGTEIDPAAAAAARARAPAATVHEGLVDELELPSGGFEAVSLVHVVEHLLDPVDTLRACARLLAPGGCVALVTPNAASLGAREFGRDWRGWEPPRHIHVYEQASLERLVERAGLRVVESRSVASAAPFLYRQSAELRGDPVSGLAALRFWLREYRRVRAGEACGEELLLLAEAATSAAAR